MGLKVRVGGGTVSGRTLAVGVLIAGMGSLASAQTAIGVTLSCPTPTSTGVTTNLSTAATVWETSGDSGATWAPAAAYFHGGPWVAATPPAAWIGSVSGPSFANVAYGIRIDASDPNIDLASATFTYDYRVDNYVVGGAFNGTALTFDSTTYNTPAAYTLAAPLAVTLTRDANNTLVFQTTNQGNPWGLAANVRLTYNCTPAVVAPVPADAPWALFGLSALMLAGVAAMRRKKGG